MGFLKQNFSSLEDNFFVCLFVLLKFLGGFFLCFWCVFAFVISNWENLLYMNNLTIGHVSHYSKHGLQFNAKEHLQNTFFCAFTFSFHNFSLSHLGSNSSQQDTRKKSTQIKTGVITLYFHLERLSIPLPQNPNLKKPRNYIICKILLND